MGPLVGVEFGVAAFVNPLVAKLPDAAYRQVRSGGSRLLGAVMPFWYIGALALLIADAAVSRNALAIAAAALMAAAVLLTVTTLVPINNRIARWQTDADVCATWRPAGTVALAAGRPARRPLPPPRDFGALTGGERGTAPKSQGGGGRGAFWLIGGWRAILGGFHRRPSVTEKSVEGPGLSRRPTQEDEVVAFLRAPTILRRGVRHFSAPSCRSAVNTRTHPRGGMHGQG